MDLPGFSVVMNSSALSRCAAARWRESIEPTRVCRFLLAKGEHRLKIPGDHSASEKLLIKTRLIRLLVEDRLGQYFETHKRACQE